MTAERGRRSRVDWMKKEPKSFGRANLEKKLREQGLSRRQSVAVVNVILGRMIHALKRGDEVEFPGGKLQRVERYFGKCWEDMDDTPANRDPYTVEWVLSREGWEQLYGPLEKEERACLEALWVAPEPEKRERRGGKKKTVPAGK